MKKRLLILICLCLTGWLAFAQQEKPEKILEISTPKKLDGYLTGKGWKLLGNFEDSISGTYYLYRIQTASKGYAYLAVYLQKFMHYQVFYTEKREYSQVLSYEDFMKMPEGKSNYNRSIDNPLFDFKSIEFNDPSDTRNINMFYGKVERDSLKQPNQTPPQK